MKVIGLTGGIASGKSTVSQMIRKLGIQVLCADEIAHLVMEPEGEAYRGVINEFGNKILNPDQTINRTHLGSIVFSSPDKRKILNSLVHPFVLKKIQEQLKTYQKQGEKVVVLDVPLLFEAKLEFLCDEVILIHVPLNIQKERLQTRDSLNLIEIEKRLEAQMSLDLKKTKVKFIIDNVGSLENTELQLKKILKDLSI